MRRKWRKALSKVIPRAPFPLSLKPKLCDHPPLAKRCYRPISSSSDFLSSFLFYLQGSDLHSQNDSGVGTRWPCGWLRDGQSRLVVLCSYKNGGWIRISIFFVYCRRNINWRFVLRNRFNLSYRLSLPALAVDRRFSHCRPLKVVEHEGDMSHLIFL